MKILLLALTLLLAAHGFSQEPQVFLSPSEKNVIPGETLVHFRLDATSLKDVREAEISLTSPAMPWWFPSERPHMESRELVNFSAEMPHRVSGFNLLLPTAGEYKMVLRSDGKSWQRPFAIPGASRRAAWIAAVVGGFLLGLAFAGFFRRVLLAFAVLFLLQMPANASPKIFLSSAPAMSLQMELSSLLPRAGDWVDLHLSWKEAKTWPVVLDVGVIEIARNRYVYRWTLPVKKRESRFRFVLMNQGPHKVEARLSPPETSRRFVPLSVAADISVIGGRVFLKGLAGVGGISFGAGFLLGMFLIPKRNKNG